MTKRILHYGGLWVSNIGNSFIDIGCKQSLLKATSNAEIYFCTESPYWAFAHRPITYVNDKFLDIITRRIHNIVTRHVSRPKIYHENLFNHVKHLHVDYLAIPGARLTKRDITLHGEKLRKISNKGVKIIFNGISGSTYKDDEVQAVRKFLEDLRPYGFISRDETAYKLYADTAEHSYRGIDCAFFLKDAFNPAPIELDYVVHNFDKKPRRLPDTGKMIVNTHHSIGKAFYNHFEAPNTLISDVPDDYLHIYANCSEMHSDRVHACLPTLVFGKPARLYTDTPRSGLFEEVKIKDITKKLVYADLNKIEKAKKAHVEFLTEIIEG